MAIYMIGHDLHPSEGENYDKLFAALEAIGTGYWDCLESTWLIMTEKTAARHGLASSTNARRGWKTIFEGLSFPVSIQK